MKHKHLKFAFLILTSSEALAISAAGHASVGHAAVSHSVGHTSTHTAGSSHSSATESSHSDSATPVTNSPKKPVSPAKPVNTNLNLIVSHPSKVSPPASSPSSPSKR